MEKCCITPLPWAGRQRTAHSPRPPTPPLGRRVRCLTAELGTSQLSHARPPLDPPKGVREEFAAPPARPHPERRCVVHSRFSSFGASRIPRTSCNHKIKHQVQGADSRDAASKFIFAQHPPPLPQFFLAWRQWCRIPADLLVASCAQKYEVCPRST